MLLLCYKHVNVIVSVVIMFLVKEICSYFVLFISFYVSVIFLFSQAMFSNMCKYAFYRNTCVLILHIRTMFTIFIYNIYIPFLFIRCMPFLFIMCRPFVFILCIPLSRLKTICVVLIFAIVSM